MDETTKSWKQWQADLSLRKEASEKKASAMHAEDPTEKGQVEAKPCGDEAHRSNINLPSNPTRNTVQTKDGIHGLCATGPYSVGEGEYPTAIDGDAKDEAYKTPATPLDKIAGNLARSAEQFTIPANIGADADIMRKMAYIGQLALADERGQALVDGLLTKQAGRAEAQAILTDAYNTLQKEAAANNFINNNMYNPLIKAAEADLVNNPYEGFGQTGAVDYEVSPQTIEAWEKSRKAADESEEAPVSEMAAPTKEEDEHVRRIYRQHGTTPERAQLAADLGLKPDAGALRVALAQLQQHPLDFVKENPFLTAGVAGGGALGLYGLYRLLAANKKKQMGKRASMNVPGATQLHAQEVDIPVDTPTYKFTPQEEQKFVDNTTAYLNEQLGEAAKDVSRTYNRVVNPTMWDKIIDWIQAHPLETAGIAGGTALGGYGLNKLLSKKKEKKASFDQAAAACARSHAAWMDTFGTQFEKKAYQQGAMDGEMMANAAEDPAVQQAMGGDAIPADDTQVSDEEIMSAIQALFESGQVTEEQVAAFLQQIQGDQVPAYTAADLAMMLQQDVESGQLDPAAADQIANEITALVQSGQMPAGGAPQPDPAAMQQGMEVQASVNRTAALYNSML